MAGWGWGVGGGVDVFDGAEGGLCAQQKSACVTRGAICRHLVAVRPTDLNIACAIRIKVDIDFPASGFVFKCVHDDHFQSVP